MSSGFFVVMFVGLIVVVTPSILAISVAWRRGGVARAGAVLALIAILCLAGLFFAPSDWPNTYEERAVLFLASWGMILALISVPIMLFILIRRMNQLRHRENQ
jgi:hypothetical protein